MCTAMKIVLKELQSRGLLRVEQFMEGADRVRYGIKKGIEFGFLYKTDNLYKGTRYGITAKGTLYLMGGISLAVSPRKGSGRGKDIPISHWHAGLLPAN